MIVHVLKFALSSRTCSFLRFIGLKYPRYLGFVIPGQDGTRNQETKWQRRRAKVSRDRIAADREPSLVVGDTVAVERDSDGGLAIVSE